MRHERAGDWLAESGSETRQRPVKHTVRFSYLEDALLRALLERPAGVAEPVADALHLAHGAHRCVEHDRVARREPERPEDGVQRRGRVLREREVLRPRPDEGRELAPHPGAEHGVVVDDEDFQTVLHGAMMTRRAPGVGISPGAEAAESPGLRRRPGHAHHLRLRRVIGERLPEGRHRGEILERVRPLGPIIAGRHSHESGTLRSFANALGYEDQADLLDPSIGDSYRLEVQDDGRGMREEERARLFQPFRSGFDGGTGIGMAIVYRAQALLDAVKKK